MIRFITVVFLLFILIDVSIAQTTTVTYQSSDVDMPNPERGFYMPAPATYASNYIPLDANFLASRRSYFTPFGANYQVHTTLVFRYFVLDDFVDASISQAFLTAMQADFDAARAAGVKLIVRFAYTIEASTGNCGNFICPPYGDASKAKVLEHIAQLKGLLNTNGDIIATVQMGFIGTWGENYYTDHFGDASISPFILTNANWTDRNDVLGALLDAVPKDRTVQVRYPQIKQRYVYGVGAPTNSPALSSSEAYNQTDKSRIGFHNDCFLASDTDFGTYNDYGPPSSQSDTLNLKPYKQDDSAFVPVGGETCFVNGTDDNCASVGGRADSELDRLHYSFLNTEYNNDVNNDWTGICMDEIKLKMGYRFSIVSGTYPNASETGSNLNVQLSIENEGYTSPYNPRGLELVLRNISTGKEFFAPLLADPRFWSTGTHVIDESLCLSPNLPEGNYALLLNLPDPEPSLFDNPDYSIQLANQNIWESSTGFNDLNHTISITNNDDNLLCYDDQIFTSTSVFDPNFCVDFLTLTQSIDTDIYRAAQTVSSTGLVDGGEDVIFQAGNHVELNNNFEVKSGAIFRAIILACD